MEFDHRKRYASTGPDTASSAPVPGKQTLTQGMVQLHPVAPPSSERSEPATAPPLPVPAGPRPTLQMLFSRRDAAPGPEQVHAAAARGTATAAGQLPHLAQIQKSFGKHDISGVQAHVGSAAAASAQEMGAAAYATGNHVVLGAGTDLHTIAHEAAHVVQQRGGVQLKGGVGEVGDAYERQADEVADAVVQGKSAEGLLEVYSVSHTNAASVQRMMRRDPPQADSATQSPPPGGPTTQGPPQSGISSQPDSTPLVGAPTTDNSGAFKVRKARNYRKRGSTSDETEEETVIRNPSKDKEKHAKRKYEEPQDSGFIKWIHANHQDKASDAAALDILGSSEAVADTDGARTVEHIFASSSNATHERQLRAVIELHKRGISWSDLRDFTRGDALLGYLDDLDAAADHLTRFGGAAVGHYGKQNLDGFRTGSNSDGGHYFMQANVNENGVLKGGHLLSKWNSMKGDLQNVLFLWSDSIGGDTVSQYTYTDKHGTAKLKTVFDTVKTGDAVFNKALADAIKAHQARTTGRWTHNATLDGGNTVSVTFTGTALTHIT